MRERIAQGFTQVEDILYVGIGVVLAAGAVGLLISLWIQARAWQGAFDEHRHVTVQNFVMYWHFVDTVWVFVLATIYLSPHFI